MRIALLSYRSKTHCGGQGVYVRHLSRGLVELGHDVEVFSGQPYPEGLDPRVRLTKVPSLDLYREPDPFRIPRPSEIHDRIDLLELLDDVDGRLPRAARRSACAWRACSPSAATSSTSCTTTRASATGLLTIAELGLPVVATVHHPITRDRVLDVAAAKWWRKPLVRRWYGFAEMQKQVARRDSGTADRLVDVGRRHRRRLRGRARASCTSCRSASTPNCSRPPSTGCATGSSRSPARTCRSRASATCCTRSPGCASSATSTSSSSRSWNPTGPPRS